MLMSSHTILIRFSGSVVCDPAGITKKNTVVVRNGFQDIIILIRNGAHRTQLTVAKP